MEKMQQGIGAEVPYTSSNSQQMTSFSLVTQNDLFQPDFSWTIDQISTLLQRDKFKVENKSLKSTQTGSTEMDGAAGLSVDTNEKVRVWLSLKKIGPFQPQIFYLIRDRSGAREPHHVCAPMHTSYVHKLIGLGGVENKSHAHKSCLVHPAYNVDDSLVVDFYVEPTAVAQHVHSYDGTLHGAIDNFRQRKQMEIGGLISGQESPYLYTSPKGYRVQLKFILQGRSGFINRPRAATRFWPRGAKFANPPLLQGMEEHKDKGPSVEVRLLRGKWDQELDKSFPHHMTLTLLNRNHPLANIVRNVEWNRGISKRKRRYVVHLCSDGQMESLVEEDTLYYRVAFREKSKNTNYYGLYTGYNTTSEKMQQQEVKAEVAPQMTSFALVTQNELFQPAFTWTIHGISKLMGRKKFKVKTKSLKATQTGYQDTDAGAGLSVEANGRVRVCLILQKVGPFQPQIFFLIRDRSGAREPQHVCASMHELFGVIFGVYTVENKNHAEKSCLTHPAYNVDDSLVVDFYVEPTAVAQHAHSNDGTLDGSIDNFRRRKQMEIAGLINGQESPYFYTGPTGYRVQLKFILQGMEENKGKGPSVKVRLLKGTWDKELPKSYSHRMTLTLLNRSDALANIERKVERKLCKNKKSYLVHLCSDQQLESLIENDTLYYYVTFENILSK